MKLLDPDGNELEVSHNYSFGPFYLTLFLDNPNDGSDREYCGIRLTRAQALELRDEIDRLLNDDKERTDADRETTEPDVEDRLDHIPGGLSGTE